MKEDIELAKDRGVAEVVTASMLYMKKHFKPLLKAQLFIAGPFLMLFSVFYSVFVVTMTGAFDTSPGSTNPFEAGLGDFFLQLSLVILLLGISFFFYIAVLLEYMKLESETKTTPTIGQIWKEILRDFWKMVLTGVGLVLIASMGMSIVMMIGMFFIVALLMITPVLGIIGYIAFLAFCLFLMAPLGLVYPACVIERRSFADALGKAFGVITGNWWKTTGLIVLSFFIQLSLTFIFQVPEFARAILGQHFHYNLEEYQALFIALSIVNILIGYIIGMIMQVMLAFQYFSLREKKEGASLIEKIDLVGTGYQPQLATDEESY